MIYLWPPSRCYRICQYWLKWGHDLLMIGVSKLSLKLNSRHILRLNCGQTARIYSIGTLRKLYFHFLSHWMGYDRGTVFLSILNQMEIYLVQNWKENCPHDHIPCNLKGNKITVFSVYQAYKRSRGRGDPIEIPRTSTKCG